MATTVRERLIVKRQRCSEHGLSDHALLIEETSRSAGRARRQLRRAVCLECDPREFVRLQAQYRR